MKRLIIGTFVAGQLLAAAPPAFAADFATGQEIQAGAFGGVQLRVPLGRAPRAQRVRAGLTLAPTLRSRAATGEVRTQIGEGLEFGYRSGRPVSFSVAGRDLQPRRLGAAQDNGDGEHHDHTLRTVLLVVGGVLVVAAVATAVVFESILANERSGPDAS
jgi:hypothetical protein